MTIPQLTRSEVQFTVEVDAEEIPVEGYFHGDDAEQDRAGEAAIRARLDRGEVEAWCYVTVKARYQGPLAPSGLEATAALGPTTLFEGSGNRSGIQVTKEAERYAKEQELYEEALHELNQALTRHIREACQVAAAAAAWQPRKD